MPNKNTSIQLSSLWTELLNNYSDGVSNTSTTKYNAIRELLATILGVPATEIYATGAKTRTSNLDTRFVQGNQAGRHTEVGVAFMQVENAATNLETLSESAVVTSKKFVDGTDAKTSYNVILIFVESAGKLLLKRVIQRQGFKYFEKLVEHFPEAQLVLVTWSLVNSPAVIPVAGSVGAGTNKIFFGPPGTGKSTVVKKEVGSAPMFRTQFHPEYSHADLIGSYRPVVGSETDAANQVVGHDGVVIARPVNYFAFVPGPLVVTLECAFGSSEHVFLVIEEINRGDCAAIFGDAFQLLDRDNAGRSEFGITPKSELLAYFKAKGVNYDIAGDGRLYLPPNLTLLATMNTSDQSLYPMDSAFKRRWEWVACPIDFEQLIAYTGRVRAFLDDGKTKWDWIRILELVNKNIVRDRMEDKQLGPWFIKPLKDGLVPWDAFLNKCLFYLWHDVFKDEQLSDLSPFKTDGPEDFSEVQANIRDNGLAAGFKPELLVPIAAAVEPVAAKAAQAPEPPQTAN